MASIASSRQKAGMERDEETGLQCHGVRYYAPWLGRWTSPDPSGLQDGTNRYLYASANPVRYRDRDGNQAAQPATSAPEPSATDLLKIGLSAYGMSAETYGWETINRTQRTAYAAATASIESDRMNANAPKQSSIGVGKTGAWETTKQFWRGIWGSDEAPAETKTVLVKTPYSVELMEVPNERYQEQVTNYVSASPKKTPAATRLGASTAKAVTVGLTVAWLAYSAPAVAARLAGASAGEVTAGALRVSGGGGAHAPMKLVRLINSGEKIADIVNEAKGLTFETGNEHALVKLASGKNALVSGGPGGINFNEGEITRVFGHTHLTNAPPSSADAEVLTKLGNSQQTVYHGGEVTKVRPKP